MHVGDVVDVDGRLQCHNQPLSVEPHRQDARVVVHPDDLFVPLRVEDLHVTETGANGGRIAASHKQTRGADGGGILQAID